MKRKSESGFSLIELLIVIVVIGIIIAISVAAYVKARSAAENRAMIGTLTTIRSAQAQFLAHNGRYARLNELNQANGNNLGRTMSATSITRGNFTLTLDPTTITDADLKNRYMIIATRPDDVLLVYTLDQSGVIEGLNEL